MIFNDILSRLKLDTIHPHEIIPISFSMQEVLHTKYYNMHENEKQNIMCYHAVDSHEILI